MICKNCGLGVVANTTVSPTGGTVYPWMHTPGHVVCQIVPPFAEPIFEATPDSERHADA